MATATNTTQAQAQENTPVNRIAVVGSRIHAANGGLLDRSEARSLLLGTPAYDFYEKALSQRTAGGILLGTGIAVASIGGFTFLLTGLLNIMGHSEEGSRDSFWRHGGGASLGITIAGVGMTVGGIVLLRSGTNNVIRAVNAYNSNLGRPSTGELTLGFTPGGVGLAYCF